MVRRVHGLQPVRVLYSHVNFMRVAKADAGNKGKIACVMGRAGIFDVPVPTAEGPRLGGKPVLGDQHAVGTAAIARCMAGCLPVVALRMVP